MRAGLPVTTLGTYDRKLGSRWLHLPSDNLGRVALARLPEAVQILKVFVEDYRE